MIYSLISRSKDAASVVSYLFLWWTLSNLWHRRHISMICTFTLFHQFGSERILRHHPVSFILHNSLLLKKVLWTWNFGNFKLRIGVWYVLINGLQPRFWPSQPLHLFFLKTIFLNYLFGVVMMLVDQVVVVEVVGLYCRADRDVLGVADAFEASLFCIRITSIVDIFLNITSQHFYLKTKINK
jgi:hypothetical protein